MDVSPTAFFSWADFNHLVIFWEKNWEFFPFSVSSNNFAKILNFFWAKIWKPKKLKEKKTLTN
jgi:hypothetical protein